MRYSYTPPIEALHEVKWYFESEVGLHEPDRPFLKPLMLIEPLRAWLDANAPGWSFSSDGGSYGESEICTLKVANEEQGKGFIEFATPISDAWKVADRERMPYRLVMKTPGVDAVEIARSHTPIYPSDHHHELRRHLEIDKQPWRREFFQAARRAHALMTQSEEAGTFAIEMPQACFKTKGTTLALVRIGAPAK